MHPAHFNLHPAHLSLHPALCNTLNVIPTLISPVSCSFPKFKPKNSKRSMFTENCPVRELGGADSKSGLSFLKFEPKTHFWENVGRKSQSYQFCPKIGTHGIWRMLIFIPTLVFRICIPTSISGQIWVKKVEVVHFDWKSAHGVSRGCWFLFCH